MSNIYDQPTEDVVLGTLLGNEVLRAKYAPRIRPALFAGDSSRLIANALFQRVERGEPVDITVLTMDLRAAGHLDSVGGPAGLMELAYHSASDSMLDAHVGTLEAMWQKREAIRITDSLSRRLSGGNFDPAEALKGFNIESSAVIGLGSINGRPALRLPGDGRPLGDFALELGKMLRSQPIFSRQGCAFTLDPEGGKLEPATPTWLRTWAERHVACYKLRVQNGQSISMRSTMTEDSARAVIQSPQFLEQLRRVERFHPCRMPIIRKDGTLELLPEGHDAESATYTAEGVSYPLNMGIEEARAVIAEAFSEFPFADDGGRSKAVAIAALLTIYAGGLMPEGSNRPVFGYLGNAEGTGKTTAAMVAGIAYGAVAAEAAPTDEAEWQKKLLASVIGGKKLLLLDNLKGHLNSPALEAYTTASRFSGRILGVSKEFSGEACATVLITGNRLTISPDMRRRALMVELFTDELRAEDRKFQRRLDDPALLDLRPRLLGACWALVRAWDAAGRPPASRTNSSFPRWCDAIGGVVESAGFACPTTPADVNDGGDTDTRDISRLGEEMVSGTKYTFAELAGLCADNDLFERFTTDTDHTGEISRKSKSIFAKILKQYDRRMVANGVKFCIEGEGHSRRYLVR